METAASFAVAEHFGMDRGSILAVFDNPRGHDHIVTTDADRDERRETAQKAMVEIALATLLNRFRKMDEQGDSPAADRLNR